MNERNLPSRADVCRWCGWRVWYRTGLQPVWNEISTAGLRQGSTEEQWHESGLAERQIIGVSNVERGGEVWGWGGTRPCRFGQPGQCARGRIYLVLRHALRRCLSRSFCLRCPGHPERCASDQYGLHSSGWLNNDCFVVVVFLSVFFFLNLFRPGSLQAIICHHFWDLFLIIYTAGKEKKE